MMSIKASDIRHDIVCIVYRVIPENTTLPPPPPPPGWPLEILQGRVLEPDISEGNAGTLCTLKEK